MTAFDRAKRSARFQRAGIGTDRLDDMGSVLRRAGSCAMNREFMRLLLVSASTSGDERRVLEILRHQDICNVDLFHVASMEEAEFFLRQESIDLVFLDLELPDAPGIEAVRRVYAIAPSTTLMVLASPDDEMLAIRSLQEGALDYLLKNKFETHDLHRPIRYAMARRRLMAVHLRETERSRATLDSIGDAVVCTDVSGTITYINPAAESLTGWTFDAAVGQSLAEAIRILDGERREALPDLTEVAIKRGRGVRLRSNCVLLRRDGSEVAIEDSVAPVYDEAGVAIGVVIVFRDVSEARTMALQLTHKAHHDFLTGLPNRVLFNDRVGHAISIAPRHMKKVAVLFLDLDGFKHINDSLGHSIGDKLLQSIARRLVDCVRASDTVSRLGGDEFVVLLSEIQHAEDAAISARRILEAVAQVHSLGRHDLRITTSIGVSIYPEDGQDAETLIKNADTAMYQAKETGRQSYQYFRPAMTARAVERQSIEKALLRALERQQFALHYQPKVDVRTGAITGAEALIRWKHYRRGWVPPAQFLAVAEECGLILPIGAWVLRQACAQAREWLDTGQPVTSMAINISATEFRDESFVDNLCGILADARLDASMLELDISEAVLMKGAASTAGILHALRAKGVHVCVDDFGTGYSSFSRLRNFPINALKIDQSFVRQISTAGEDTTIVTAVIGMARNLQLKVIAEGVEAPEELAFLRRHQCDEAQGYYFSKPVPPHRFVKLMQASLAGTGVFRPAPAGEDIRSEWRVLGSGASF